MRAHPLGQQKVGRNRLPPSGSGLGNALREGGHRRHHNGRVRALKRLGDGAHACFMNVRSRRADVPKLALDVVGRLARPNLQDLVDGLQKHGRPGHVHVAKDLGIRGQCARADAQDEAPAQEVVEHGNFAGHRRRVVVGHV